MKHPRLLLINASPRRHGLVSEMLSLVENRAREAGIEVELFFLLI